MQYEIEIKNPIINNPSNENTKDEIKYQNTKIALSDKITHNNESIIPNNFIEVSPNVYEITQIYEESYFTIKFSVDSRKIVNNDSIDIINIPSGFPKIFYRFLNINKYTKLADILTNILQAAVDNPKTIIYIGPDEIGYLEPGGIFHLYKYKVVYETFYKLGKISNEKKTVLIPQKDEHKEYIQGYTHKFNVNGSSDITHKYIIKHNNKYNICIGFINP